MRLFVLGATGGTGTAFVAQALAADHEVTAFVRSPDKMAQNDTRLTVKAGDPRREDALVAALPGHDAVISTLGSDGTGRTTLVLEE